MADPVQTLQALRRALRQADYPALAALAAELEAALPAAAALPETALRALRAEAEQTAACLAAARSGLRAARRRMAEIRAASDGLSTYDRHGRSARQAAGSAQKRL
jgi:hypothetical protein